MAYVDTSGSLSGQFGGVAPAPTGGGIPGGAGVAAGVTVGAPGAKGYGSGASIRTWVYIYLAFIVGMLVLTGVLFNGKGRK